MRDAADFEQFAASHAALILHVATLLTGNESVAEGLALDALRRVHTRGGGGDDRTRLLRVSRLLARSARGHAVSVAPAREPLELHDLRPASQGASATVPSSDAIISAGLRALSDTERTVLVLHIIAGLSVEDLRTVVRRPGAWIRRDLATSLDFLADATATPAASIESRVRQALQMRPRARAEVAALLEKLHTLIAADRRKLPRPRAGWIAAAVAATAAALVAGLLIGRPGVDEGDTPKDQAAERPAPLLDLPATASGLKLVGYKRIMLAVPEAWTQVTSLCISTRADSVRYPIDDELPPCLGASAPTDTVAFGAYDAIEGGIDFERARRRIAGEAVLTSQVIERGGEFLQYAALKNANVAVAVRSTKRADLAMIVSSVQEVPAAYVVVPNCVKLEPGQAADLLGGSGLQVRTFTDSSASGTQLPMEVVTQSPAVGTLAPFDATVNIGVLPK